MTSKFIFIIVSLIIDIIFGTIVLLIMSSFNLFSSHDLTLIELLTLFYEFLILLTSRILFLFFRSYDKILFYILLLVTPLCLLIFFVFDFISLHGFKYGMIMGLRLFLVFFPTQLIFYYKLKKIV